MHKNSSNKTALFFYKSIVYILLYLVFLLVFSRVNYALLKVTRTSVITSVAFFTSLAVMQHIYGGFQIGEEKSKPIVLSTSMALFFVNIISIMVLYIMGINEFGLKAIVYKYVGLFIVVFLIQIMITAVAVHLGNYLYFKKNSPERVILIHDGCETTDSIVKYIKSYDKQYDLVDVFNINHDKYDLNDISRVFLVADEKIGHEIKKQCILKNIDLVYKANLLDVVSIKSNYQVIDDILMVHQSSYSSSFTQDFLKRALDIFISIIALVITMPIFILVGIAIKMEDGGPIFFKQERITKDGALFNIVKFRSMRENAGNQPVTVDDDRITKTGEFIRRFRIDELPQFINILKGDMSVVGPRPESRSQFSKIEKEVPDFHQRLRVKGGLTGYAQIFGKYNTSPEQKLILDMKYIHNFNIFEDIRLIFQTLIVFFKRDSTEAFDG